jgi:hypothetical protein
VIARSLTEDDATRNVSKRKSVLAHVLGAVKVDARTI